CIAGFSSGGPSAHSDVISPPNSPSSCRALVEEIRRRGRACFSSHNYPYAYAEVIYGKGAEVLSSALGDDDGDDGKKDLTILHSNRSLCRFQMDKVAEALEDADATVEYDPAYDKGHWRRGQAQLALGNSREALASFERALALEPGNKAPKKEARAAKEKVGQERRLMEEAKKAGKESDCGNGGDVVILEAAKPVTKQPNQERGQGAAVKDTVGSIFTASDHIWGYKLKSDGCKTLYFDREINDEAGRLSGDIVSKKLGEGGGSEGPKPIEAAAEGTSAWNE
ncbi:hypothetical protein ACHAWF_001042, partial [Thalassiosira exigua]